MRFPIISNLLQTRQEALFREMAGEMSKSGLVPGNPGMAEMVKFARTPSEIIFRYIEQTGELNEWLDYAANTSQEAVEEEIGSAESYKAISKICFTTVKQFIKRELPGAENQAEIESFFQQLDRLETIGNVSAIRAELKVMSDKRKRNKGV